MPPAPQEAAPGMYTVPQGSHTYQCCCNWQTPPPKMPYTWKPRGNPKELCLPTRSTRLPSLPCIPSTYYSI